MRRTIAAFLTLGLMATAPVAGRQVTDTRTQRLATLGRVWLAVKFAHPRVALTNRDWDAVLTDALPVVEAAKDDRAFEEAVASMLRTLDDPATRVHAAGERAMQMPVAAKPVRPAIAALPDGAVLIDVRAPGALSDAMTLRAAITDNLDTIAKADRLVVDVRGTRQSGWTGERVIEALNELLVAAPLPLPADRYVRHSGYRAQLGGASFYSSDVVTESAAQIKPRDGMRPRKVAFVVDQSAIVPPIALALQAAGLGALVSVGDPPATPVRTQYLQLTAGASAMTRVADLVWNGRRIELTADETMAPRQPDDRVHARAAELAAARKPSVAGIEDPAPIWQPDPTYSETPYPSAPHRLLAVYRLWGVMENFLPYKHLLDRSWDHALTTFIPRALAARDELEYARAMAEMATLTQDSHVNVTGSRALTKYVGEVPPPVSVRFVEGRPIVTRIADAQAAPGLKVGDEIVTIDGEDAAARAKKIEQVITFSTPAGRNRVVAQRLLSGDAGSVARVSVRGADGAPREVAITRPAKPVFGPQRDGEVFRILDGNIGYADLERLEVAQVAAMFDRFRETTAIVFDMRGYPRGTAWSIAPRINTKKATAAALFYRPMMAGGSTAERLSFIQDLPPTTTWVYERPTVMLIDDRALSQSEHTGLFFKAANGTTFVGSPTTGANGDVTSMTLPGGLRVSFTGHDVRWPDGRQLQRVGLIPDVPATPTIAGVRAGRDEVLEAALAFLKNRKGS